VVKASKEAGAEGGTTILGQGTASGKVQRFLGIPLETEKEIILTVVQNEKAREILAAITRAGNLDKPGYGIAFVLPVKQVAGICHLCVLSEPTGKRVRRPGMENLPDYDLIVTIVNRDTAEVVVEASKKNGAAGGTILFGRGTGIHEQAKLFGITIEPEKEIVLTLIDNTKTDAVLEAIIREAKLDHPGKGIAFVLEVSRVAGVNHLLNQMVADKMAE
jgi:nitrogen regulatory protein PII